MSIMTGLLHTVSNLAFYCARRDEMRQQAADTPLANVRERCERAAAAFSELADRAEKAEHSRERDALRRTSGTAKL